MDIETLTARLQQAWCADTSAEPERWTPNAPSRGQCAVTALVVQDALGGDLVWGEVVQPDGQRISHYWNRVDGVDIDLTRAQFPPGSVMPAGVVKPGAFASTRLRVLSFESTRTRYELLKARLQALVQTELDGEPGRR